jgi:hypothetical protein
MGLGLGHGQLELAAQLERNLAQQRLGVLLAYGGLGVIAAQGVFRNMILRRWLQLSSYMVVAACPRHHNP